MPRPATSPRGLAALTQPIPARRPLAATLLVISTAFVAACGGAGGNGGATPATEPQKPTATAATPATGGAIPAAAVAEAEQIFATRCTPCHGATGKGDGAASAALAPPPRDFTSPEWQASVTDEHIETIVKYGGAAVGRAATMPSNPDLIAKSDVVKALRAHVRSLKQ